MQYRQNFEEDVSVATQERLDTSSQAATQLDERYREDTSMEDVQASLAESHIRQKRAISQTTWQLILIGGDACLLIAVFILAILYAPFFQNVLGITRYPLGTWDGELALGILSVLVWSIATRVTQAQDFLIASNPFRSLISTVFALTFLFVVLLTCSVFIFHGRESLYEMLSIYFMAGAVPAFGLWRLLFAGLVQLPCFRRRAVIVGINTAGKTLAKEVARAKRPGITIVGYVDRRVEADTQEKVPLFVGRSALRQLVQSRSVDMIIMALDSQSNPDLFQEAIEAVQQGVSLVPMTRIYESTSGKIPVAHIGEQWHTALPVEHHISLFYFCWRTLLDFLVGVSGIVVLAAILPLLTVLIYLDSPGPIFYRQTRMGLQGKSFRIYKFRSMRADSEQQGAQWASEHDARITQIGRFLRATHLDELPQVFNILRGDMSLIGPRPEQAAFVTELEKTIPFYRCRLVVKPGLTGWAQVKYRYGNSDTDALIKLQYDLYYIKHQSFMFDIFIILKTIGEVVFGRGV
ncbi:MAG: sugar transferase [Chloroflexota bacterium]|nr:sugar transferase [Chloroflexota bacterium]